MMRPACAFDFRVADRPRPLLRDASAIAISKSAAFLLGDFGMTCSCGTNDPATAATRRGDWNIGATPRSARLAYCFYASLALRMLDIHSGNFCIKSAGRVCFETPG